MNDIANLLQVIAAVVGVFGVLIGGLIAAMKMIGEWRRANYLRKEANDQRREELRWRQAEEGRKVLDDLFLSDKHDGFNALVMTDLAEEKEPVPFEDRWMEKIKIEKHDVREKDVLEALKLARSPKAAFIIGCFDDLFFYLDRIGYYLEEKRIELKDVLSPLDYYSEKMAHWPEYEGYALRIRADRALRLLKKLPGWQRGAAAGGLKG